MASPIVGFRCPDDVIRKLDELCELANCTRSEFFVTMINSEYDKINGNPQLKQILKQFAELGRQIKSYAEQTTVVDVVSSGATDVAGNGGEV